jgi:hypothetical protein
VGQRSARRVDANLGVAHRSGLVMLALFGAAGSAAWERTRSFTLAVIASAWCALVAMLILLCFAFSFNLAFEARVELQLLEAFAASGMNDPDAFAVKNSLEAASEELVRMSAFAMFISFAGTLANAWKLCALDSADSQAPHLARKSICFLCPALCGASEKQGPKPTECSAFRGSDRFTPTGCVPNVRLTSLSQRKYR